MAGNQYQPDPRQSLFLQAYLDPKSKTFSNAKQSAIEVGYSEEYADNIMSLYPDWLSEAIGQDNLLKKAEKNLEKLLDQEDDIKVKADITKFVASRAGKHKWSERHEHTGAEGKELKTVVINYANTRDISTEGVPDTTTPST